MFITEEKLNNICVRPVKLGDQDNNVGNVKGFKLVPSLYFNMFICSRKKSGKSSLINILANKCTDKRTVFWIFCGTYQIDPTWKEIIKSLTERGNIVNAFDSIIHGKTNLLDEILEDLNAPFEEKKEETKEETKEEIKLDFGLNDAKSKMKKEYVPKKKACKHMFIFDDISQELKNPSLSRLLKVHRHFLASVIVSSQYLHDIQKQSIVQLDIFITFKGFTEQKMDYIHKLLDLSIPMEKFWEIYKHCTLKPYSFMYLNVRTEEFRCCFDKKIIIDE